MRSTIPSTCTVLIVVILGAKVVNGRRGMAGDYSLIAKDPALKFCTEQLLLEGDGNVISRMAFNGNDTVCTGGSITMVPKGPRHSGHPGRPHFRSSENRGGSSVRLRSMERFPCGVELFRLVYTRYPRGSGIQATNSYGTSLYRKVMTLRTGGRHGPTCIYARGSSPPPTRPPTPTPTRSPTPTPSRTPSPSPSPGVVMTQKRREEVLGLLGLALAIVFGVFALITFIITLVYCTPLVKKDRGLKKEAWFGGALTVLCTLAAIIAEVLT